MSVQAGRTLRFFNNVTAAGNFTGPGTVEFLAGFSPGPALVAGGTGVASFDGAVAFGPASVTTLDLASPDAFDRVDAAGGLDAGGTLQVALLNGFTPGFWQTFDLFDAPAITGRFDRLTLPTLTDGLSWDASALYATGSLTVVPEPAPLLTALLAACGAGRIAARRRRHLAGESS